MTTTSTKTTPSFFTLKEAAAITKMSEATLRQAVRDEKLRAYQPNGLGGKLIFCNGDLYDWVTGTKTFGKK
ncbi:MAG TPA: helix-turn-helix domain-containing protein [Chthoniobacterales bacterium]|jgi:excisionase family DNA binding protein